MAAHSTLNVFVLFFYRILAIALKTLRIAVPAYKNAAAICPNAKRIVPNRNSRDDGEERLDVWGFSDTQFRVDKNDCVEVTGSRYPLSGQKLPSLLPWIRNFMGLNIGASTPRVSCYPTAVPDSIINEAFVTIIYGFLQGIQISFESSVRLRHGHGQSQEEMYAIKYGRISRVPDVVVYPASENEVVSLVEAATQHDVCLIPFGGGSNVSEALLCPQDERRMIVSVDMRRMNRILWLDKTNRIACIEAGAVGRHIMQDLAEHGYTMGHEPDSVEFSTLGGWIATNASGMKRNKYGNIEALVLDVNVVTANGLLQRRSSVVPREAVGLDHCAMVFGSEGSFGIITSAVVKLFPLPEVQKYGSILFSDFEKGVAFLYDLAQTSAQPASVRLVDNAQFQFSMALKPQKSGFLHRLKSSVERAYVLGWKGFEPEKMVACTLVFEGTVAEVKQQEANVWRLSARHHGMNAGEENGRRGYLLTYNIAYIRDFVMQHYVLAESFETSVLWSRVLELCERTKKRVYDEHQSRALPGKPFVSCRVTQLYGGGAAVYFYFAYFYEGVPNPSAVYAEMEHAARDEILKCGGSLSHHHGVGKLRKDFLPRILSPAALLWRRHVKDAVDMRNVFGCDNGLGLEINGKDEY